MSITTVRERVVGFSQRLTADERQLAGRWGLREYVEPKVIISHFADAIDVGSVDQEMFVSATALL